MPLDPSTLCARTAAGDAELAAPRHGLAIAQRRLLSLLDHPVPLDELVRRPGVLPDRLEKDLGRLSESGLVELHAPSTPSAVAPPRPVAKPLPVPRDDAPRPWLPAQPGLSASAAPSAAPESRVVNGRRVRHGRALVLGFLTLVVVCAVAWWLGAPSAEPRGSAASELPVAASAPVPAPIRLPEPIAVVPEPVRVSAVPESFVTVPAPAVPPEQPSPPAAARPVPQAPPATPDRADAQASAANVVRPPVAEPPVAIVPPRTVPRADPAAEPVAAAAPPPASAAPLPQAPPATVPASPVVATPAASATASPPPPAAPVPPPVQLAAAPASTVPAPAAPRRLEPVTRETPAFPREALASGVTKGTVRARVAIDASGKVTGVEILEAEPRRVFDRAVTRALSRWTWEPGEPSRTSDVEIAFHRD